MPKEPIKPMPEVEAEPVSKGELQVVRAQDKELSSQDGDHKKPRNIFIGTLNVIAQPLKNVYDPIKKVCYEPLAAHYEERYRRKFPKHHSKILILDLTLLAIIGALAVFWIFSKTLLPLLPATPIVQVQTLAPSTIVSGETTDFVVAYTNDSPKALGCAKLRIQLPADTVLAEPLPALEDSGKTCAIEKQAAGVLRTDAAQNDVLMFTIGDIAPNGRDAVRFKAKTYGPTGDTKVLTADLSYWEEAATEPTQVSSRSEWQIVSSALALSLDMPQNVSRGLAHKVTIAYANRGTDPITDAVIRLSPPGDFVVTGADPAAATRNEWRPGMLAPGAEGTISVYGYFRTSASGQQTAPTFAARGYVGGQDGKLILAELVRKNADPLATDVEFAYDIAYPAGRQALLPDETVTVAIRYRNSGKKAINGLRVTLDPGAPYVRSMSPEGLTWDEKTNPELAVIKPGDAGTLTANMVVNGAITPEMLGADAYPALHLAARAQYALDGDPMRPILVDTQVTDMPIATNLGLNAAALYFTNDGDQLGIGPLPPKVGQTTKYRIFLTATTTTGGVNDAWLEAYLPTNVEWTGRASVTAGDALDYFPSTGRVRWNIGRIPAFADGTGTRIGASFEVSITPRKGDAGSAPPLLKSIKIAGTDAVTGLKVHATAETISTDLPYDQRAAGKGTVEK